MVAQEAGSYWLASTSRARYPALDRDVEADVVVVGAGIAGVSTAWELAEAGHHVVLLEAGRVLSGVTGHTTAKLSALHTFAYSRLRDAMGPEAAALYAQSQQQAVEHVFEVAARLGVACDLERVPAYTYVSSPSALERARAEAEAAEAAGLPASLVTETGLPFRVAAAVRVEDQAQFHPLKYLLALVQDLSRRGSQVHEDSRVVGLVEGHPCKVTTDNGATVTARHVVVATHYPVFDRALLFARLESHRELVVAAELPAEDDPQGMYVTPEENTRSVRTAPLDEGRRLLIVTGESFGPGSGEVRRRWDRLAEWTALHFPRGVVKHRWAAQDNSSTDHLPLIGPLHPGTTTVHVAAGFGGWGMSTGVMAGQLLAASIDGKPTGWAGLYDPGRRPSWHAVGSTLRLQTKSAGHFIGDRLRSDAGSSDDIAPGTGAVVRVGGRQCAAFRDETGQLHALSARCTHLGCIVRFNDAELAWECPCHGSRFAVDGSVLHGPATRPLRKFDLPT